MTVFRMRNIELENLVQWYRGVEVGHKIDFDTSLEIFKRTVDMKIMKFIPSPDVSSSFVVNVCSDESVAHHLINPKKVHIQCSLRLSQSHPLMPLLPSQQIKAKMHLTYPKIPFHVRSVIVMTTAHKSPLKLISHDSLRAIGKLSN